jgi:hypothetical protein
MNCKGDLPGFGLGLGVSQARGSARRVRQHFIKAEEELLMIK